jgi:hypothetical protein
MRKAYEQSPAAVQKWLDEQYPIIAACAKVEGAEIHWGDETGLRSDDVRGRSFAPQGQTPVVRHTREILSQPERSNLLILRDTVEFEPRFLRAFTVWFVRRFFAHRHAVLRRELGAA